MYNNIIESIQNLNQMKISIIIATYNWPEALDACLKSLLPQIKKYPQVELIIADDGSTQSTAELINKYNLILPDQIKHIWHKDNGFQKSLILNKAVIKSQGEYLLFLDGDCIPFADYIQQHMKLAETGYFVAGNRVLLSKIFTTQLINQPEKIFKIFNWNILQWAVSYFKKNTNKLFPWARLGNSIWRYSRSRNWKYPKGCNFAVWRKDFIEINGFDEEFSGWGHEDADLFIRLLHKGTLIKNGRFALPVLHLWHKESDRSWERNNHQRLMDRLADKNFIKANRGINDPAD